MENDIVVYIKNMFASTLPEWDETYEGVLLYDTTNSRWVGGDSIGWVIIEEEV